MVDLTLQQQYNRSVTSWQQSISEFEEAVDAYAQATADYKQARGRLIVKAKFDNPKIAALHLEAMADADDDVAELLHKRLIAEAAVDGLKQRLAWHRAQADNLRTQVVDEREQNKLASQGGAGPGRMQEPSWSSPPSGGTRPPAGRTPPPAPSEPYMPPPAAYSDDDAPPVRDWDPADRY